MKLKSLFTVVLAAVLLLCMLTGCLGAADDTQGGDRQSQQLAPGAPFSDKADMAAVINGVTYPVRVDSASVLAALGNDYDYDEVVSCVYEGYDKTFEYEDIRISTVPYDNADIIEMITITGGDHSTTRGIKVGASRQDVIKAYGENFTSDDGYYLVYTENGDPDDPASMRIMFKMDGDTVEEICIYSPSYSNN